MTVKELKDILDQISDYKDVHILIHCKNTFVKVPLDNINNFEKHIVLQNNDS